jgi:HD domain
MKHNHEFRDPVHTFISVRTEERKVIDSRPFQRLRNIHQLALTYLVYPGATHKRFEHSLGVMELASRIFDVVMKPENIHHNSVREIIPDAQGLSYWKSVLRMAALCHDVGHLPFYRMRPPRPVARRQRRLGQRAYRAAIAEEGELATGSKPICIESRATPATGYPVGITVMGWTVPRTASACQDGRWSPTHLNGSRPWAASPSPNLLELSLGHLAGS